jgi:pimeloyl-ACP methyl ester carboxylesterase
VILPVAAAMNAPRVRAHPAIVRGDLRPRVRCRPTSPIQVIGNTTDPFLPLRDATARTHQLGNARLLVVHGYGHTALLNPSTCASNSMTAYFNTGALPPKGTVCGQNPPPFAPPPGNAARIAADQAPPR